MKVASTARRIFDPEWKRTFATQSAKSRHGRSRWNIFKQWAEPRCENSILHKKSVEKKTVSIAGFLIYPSLWAIIVYGAVVHIRSVRPQANRALFFGREKPFRKFQEQPRSLRD